MGAVRGIPATGDSRAAIFSTTPGGLLDLISTTVEDTILDTAQTDAERSAQLARDPASSADELRTALKFTAADLRRVIAIAEQRADDGQR